ncbi:DUF255 domain-containing protein [Synechococcales cyanobacterium C]|uniref:DUF255 domain-containing protein n=1 Tax=Petrachloros mirabilis ULC683 TaxID=2781853 RepID=A0A8K1ZZU9_9CYAN|nr:thioredoxin domain-containing protein [Petrachloros mirabilis]NCJ07156.1 DUF255 domain-containing protein [Petrachloros mirabilis ULC683]
MTNRLASAQSLYLRKHAENPIDWWPWCEDALTQACQENKPIFLSVGYSSCHWCTVMEGEAFSDLEIAAYMNANFLPIKVDREERPDIDSIYMQAVQAMTGQGGWPMNVFLTPGDRVPFYGGTYFPIEPRYGRPGFLQVLQAIRGFYDTEKEKLDTQKQKLFGYLRSTTELAPVSKIDPELLRQGIEQNTAVVGRSSYGPSFPMIPYAAIALQGSRLQSDAPSEVCEQRGLDLALGGIYDHVAGGFHRYTVDPQWTVPHFEKMLYDNGQIMEYLANLWSAGIHEPAFERAVSGTVSWLQREMSAPEGYFYAAQDADSFISADDAEPEEGRFYCWTADDLEQHLTPDQQRALAECFYLKPEGNFEAGLTVLQRRTPGPLPEPVETACAKLFTLRYGDLDPETPFPPARNNQAAKTHPWPGRIPPVTDTKMIVAWNSLMISGLARAATVWENTHYLALARQAADFILSHQWHQDQFYRLNYDGQAVVLAQSEDYALFIKALLDLHQASLSDGDPETAQRWLQSASQVQAEFDHQLWAIADGGYYNATSTPEGELLIRERSWLDNATPSANGVAITNLVRLALLCEDLTYLERGQQALETFGQAMQSSPTACPSLFAALDWFQHHTLIRTSVDHIRAWGREFYWPTVVMQVSNDLPTDAIGLVCQGLACQEPAGDITQLQQQVQGSQSR